jgi:histidine triad (HIT) family protein
MTEKQKYDPDNIFAKIIRGDMSCVKVYEDEAILAFMDIFPQSEGHTLVIPKKAKATMLFDIDIDRLKELIEGVQKIAKAVDRALKPDGMRVIQFNGNEAGQTVFHIHFHIIPVYAGAQLGRHAGGAPADSARLTEIASKIAGAL